LSAAYANFCRVTGTPEELVLDFGLNTQMTPVATEPVKLTHRLVMNYFTAKRLLGALHMAVQQHENTYGVLETDIQKRVRQGGAARPGPRLDAVDDRHWSVGREPVDATVEVAIEERITDHYQAAPAHPALPITFGCSSGSATSS
jgi:hypothetical protein